MVQGSQYRLAFFEMLLYWQGSCRSQQLIEQFHVSRQAVNQDINFYRQTYPENIRNDRSPFEASDTFVPHIYGLSQTEYLDWLATKQYTQVKQEQTPSWFYSSQVLMPTLTTDIMRPIVEALMSKRRLDVDYGSLKIPEVEGRIIQPHTLVKTAKRYHLRAYCEKASDFRDFVLTRIKGAPELLDDATRTVDNDIAWQTKVKIIVAPDARLSALQKQVLADDYQMENGQLVLTVPGAMVQYTLEDLGINWRSYAPSPLAQQFEVVNLSDITSWLIK